MPLLLTVVVSMLLQAGILATPWSRHVFGVTPLESSELVPMVILGLLPIAIMEVWKLGIRINAMTGVRAGRPS